MCVINEFVNRKLHFETSPYRISQYKFFRLLEYTASYF